MGWQMKQHQRSKSRGATMTHAQQILDLQRRLKLLCNMERLLKEHVATFDAMRPTRELNELLARTNRSADDFAQADWQSENCRASHQPEAPLLATGVASRGRTKSRLGF